MSSTTRARFAHNHLSGLQEHAASFNAYNKCKTQIPEKAKGQLTTSGFQHPDRPNTQKIPLSKNFSNVPFACLFGKILSVRFV